MKPITKTLLLALSALSAVATLSAATSVQGIAINPQPEPPGAIRTSIPIRISTPVIKVGLNPQPEPPASIIRTNPGIRTSLPSTTATTVVRGA